MKWICIDENRRNRMETTETKKRADKPVQLEIAKLPGRRYEEDKPRDCRYCYYWAGRVRGCSRKECWYLIPIPEKPKKEFDLMRMVYRYWTAGPVLTGSRGPASGTASRRSRGKSSRRHEDGSFLQTRRQNRLRTGIRGVFLHLYAG